MRRVLLWLISSIACAVPAIALAGATEALLPPKHVAVVSLLGGAFHGIGMGLTRFGNSEYSPSVPDWNIDGDTASFVLSALGGAGYSASLLDIRPKRPEDYYIKGHADDADLKELRRIAAGQGFDTIVVVEGASDTLTRVLAPGYGLFEQGAFGITNVSPYALFEVAVLDVTSGKEIASKYSYGTEGRPPKTIPWKKSFEDYSEDERSLIKGGIEDHIHHEITRILTAMRLLKPGTTH